MSHKKIFLIATFFLTFSCTNKLQNLVHHEQELKARGNFNGYLALEYLQYARDLSRKHHWQDSNYFSEKGLKASRDEVVFPEFPEKWDLDNTRIEEATLGRQKLIALLANPKANQTLPIQLAHLQLLYDCWVSRAQDPWQIADMGRCKILFFRLTNEIEAYLDNLKPKKEIKIIEIKEPEFSRFDIYFDLNLYKFNSGANKTFRELFRELEILNGDYRILLVGNADRLGKKLYNDVLARRRVLAVKNLLIKNGIPEDLIEIKSFGEKNPEILTQNDTQNKNNRRVSIYVSKGPDSLAPIPLPLIDNYIYKKDIIKSKKERGID